MERNKERYLLLLALGAAACANNAQETSTPASQALEGKITPTVVNATETPEPTRTQTPTITPTPTSTLTPQPTSTPTSTPDIMATNQAQIERSLVGERIILNNLKINRVIVLDLPLIKPLIYGATTDESGKTLQLIENFDCQFDALRDDDELGELIDRSFLGDRVWGTDVEFDELEVIRSRQIGDVEVLTSQSFVYNDERTECVEDPALRPLGEALQRAADRVIELVDGLRN